MGIDKAREWLSSYQELEFEYNSWLERLSQYKNAQFFPVLHLDKESKHNPNAYDRMGSATIRRMDFEDKYAEKIAEIITKMKTIEAAIKDLPNPMHRGILVQRYIIGHDGYKLKP